MIEIPLQLEYIRYWRIETWTAIVAFVALAQPWAVALYKRVLRSGRLEIYETGLPEIGYSLWGATIALYGTLRSRDRELFVKSVELQVKRLDDTNAQRAIRRVLQWVAFRPLTTVMGRATLELEMTQPASFMVNPLQPYQYNIFFSELPFKEQLQKCVLKAQEKWVEKISESGKLEKIRSKTRDPSGQQKLVAQYLNESYPDFITTTQYRDVLEEIRKLMPWKAGTYELAFIAETANPNRTYKRSWLIVLTDEHEAGLNSNAEKILEGACKDTFILHHFAYPNYLPNARSSRNRVKNR